MANTLTETRKSPTLRGIKSIGTIVLSGSYPAGGETLVFPTNVGTTKPPYTVELMSRRGNFATYDIGTSRLRIWTAPNVEFATGAYGAPQTADTIDYIAEFPRGG